MHAASTTPLRRAPPASAPRNDYLALLDDDAEVQRRRLQGTLAMEMAHPEGARIGIGDMDDERLKRLIERLVRVKRLPRTPAIEEVFDRSFLPPPEQRVRSLAR